MKLESEGIKAIKEIFTNGSYANNNIKIQRVLENLRSKDDDNIESNNNNSKITVTLAVVLAVVAGTIMKCQQD